MPTLFAPGERLKPVYGPFAPYDRNLLRSKSVDEVDGDAKTVASAMRSSSIARFASQAKDGFGSQAKDEGRGRW